MPIDWYRAQGTGHRVIQLAAGRRQPLQSHRGSEPQSLRRQRSEVNSSRFQVPSSRLGKVVA